MGVEPLDLPVNEFTGGSAFLILRDDDALVHQTARRCSFPTVAYVLSNYTTHLRFGTISHVLKAYHLEPAPTFVEVRAAAIAMISSSMLFSPALWGILAFPLLMIIVLAVALLKKPASRAGKSDSAVGSAIRKARGLDRRRVGAAASSAL